jgi:ornithine cyclodeaminase
MQVYSQTSGRLLALLLDEGLLTELRTAAWSAMVFKIWLQKSFSSITMLGIMGTGVQAHYQLAAIANETPCRNVVIYGRTPAKVEALKRSLQHEGWTVCQVVDDPNDLLIQCDVVITTTSARQPVLTAPTAARTRLLITVGADAVGKTELGRTLIQSAALRIADDATQSRHRGEFQGCSDDIVIHNLGDWILNDASPLPDRGLTVADSSGVALQDCVIAQMVYDSL